MGPFPCPKQATVASVEAQGKRKGYEAQIRPKPWDERPAMAKRQGGKSFLIRLLEDSLKCRRVAVSGTIRQLGPPTEGVLSRREPRVSTDTAESSAQRRFGAEQEAVGGKASATGVAEQAS